MTRPFASFPFTAPASAWRLAFVALAVLAALLIAIDLMSRPLVNAGYVADRPRTEMMAVDVWQAPLRSSARDRVAASTPRIRYATMQAAEEQSYPPSVPALPRTDMLIRTGSLQLRVDSLAPSVARAESIAARLGGVIAGSAARGSAGGLTGATITIRVPASAWNRLLAALGRLGSVEDVISQVDDVGEEYVDVEARLANGRRLESRLITLLATRTGKLEDVLAAERELARVREGLETLEGRRRYLAANVTQSTLRVTLVTGAVVSGMTHAGMFREAAGQAWGSFLWLIAFIIRASGVVLPLALAALLGWGVHRRFLVRDEAKLLPLQRLNAS